MESDQKQEYLDLVKTLNYHAERYYNQDEPEISDYEYDTLNNKLKQIEKFFKKSTILNTITP